MGRLKMVVRSTGLLLGLFLCIVQLDGQKTGNRAASQQVNCGCQCSNLTFRDKYGRVQGNCKSADHTGAKWCYVNSWSSPCQDKQRSKRFNKPWSYAACATPPAHLCFGGGGSGSCGRWGCGNGGFGVGGGGNSCTCPRSTRVSPVCGRDGRTYQHSCACTCAGSSVQCQGACPCGGSGGFGGGSGGFGGGSGGFGGGSGGCGSSSCGSSGSCGSLAQILGTCGRSGSRNTRKGRRNG